MRRSKHNDDSRLFFDWLEIAARDLLAAKVLLQEEQCLEIAGFHCQQCMEKTMKAYLIHTTGYLVDGHNLTWLCRQAAKQETHFKTYMERMADMNRLYIETRYPSDRDLNLSAQDINEYYDTAEEIYNLVCSIIYGEGDDE